LLSPVAPPINAAPAEGSIASTKKHHDEAAQH
jgi:hypothetical protein